MDRLGTFASKRAREDNEPITSLSVQGPPRPPTTAEVIGLLHEAGGLVFLAHPLAGIGTTRALEEVLEWLQPEGLDGMEVFHKPYPEEVQQSLLNIAMRRRLLCIAGSDFHGIHHSDGTDPGVDMPLIHWKEFLSALDYGIPGGSLTGQADKLVT
jgi:predicted metal-dependent phosphoesterase TrpH